MKIFPAYKNREIVVQRETGERKEDPQAEELDRFQRDAEKILITYWILLCEASREFTSPHFEEAWQELSITEYRLQCLRENPAEYYADKKAVRKIGEIGERVAGWFDYPGSGTAVSG